MKSEVDGDVIMWQNFGWDDELRFTWLNSFSVGWISLFLVYRQLCSWSDPTDYLNYEVGSQECSVKLSKNLKYMYIIGFDVVLW